MIYLWWFLTIVAFTVAEDKASKKFGWSKGADYTLLILGCILIGLLYLHGGAR